MTEAIQAGLVTFLYVAFWCWFCPRLFRYVPEGEE